MKQVGKVIFIVALAACFGLLAVFWVNRQTLRLPDAERGVFFLTEDTTEITKLENGAYRLRFRKDPASKKTILREGTSAESLPGAVVERLLFGLQQDGTKPAALRIETYTRAKDKNAGEVHVIRDLQPIQIGTEILQINQTDVWQMLIIPENGQKINISDLRIDNTVQKSPYVFLAGMLGAGTLLGMLLFWKNFAGKPHRSLILIGLLLGLLLAVCLPRGKVGYDEETHLQAVTALTGKLRGGLHISDAIFTQLMVTEYNNPKAQPGAAGEMQEYIRYLNREGNYRDGRRTPEFDVMGNRIPAYAAMAGGMWAGEQAGLPWGTVLLLTRLANLLLYLLLMAAAVRRMPCGKYLLALIALFPENLFLAVTFSYDPFVTGMLSLGFACLLRAFCGVDGTFDWKNAALMCGAFLLGCLPKAVYAPLLLSALALPAAKFKKRKEHVLFCILVVLLFCALIGSFILPTVFAPAETGDVRGGATSEASQVGLILASPLSFAALLLSQMVTRFAQCFFGPDCTTYMGHLVNSDTSFHGYYGLFLALLLFVLVPHIRFWNIKRREAVFRLFLFLMIGGACVLIWTSMYVAFTEPGADVIAGVQGRYFIPLICPLYLLLYEPYGIEKKKEAKEIGAAGAMGLPLKQNGKPEKIGKIQNHLARKLAASQTVWYDLSIWIACAGMVLTIWTAVVTRFCL